MSFVKHILYSLIAIEYILHFVFIFRFNIRKPIFSFYLFIFVAKIDHLGHLLQPILLSIYSSQQPPLINCFFLTYSNPS